MIADSCCHAERDCTFDSFHSSHSRRSETDSLRECRIAPATGRFQTQRSAAKAEQSRSMVLGRPVHDLARLEVRIDDGTAGDRNFLASPAVQTVLVEVIAT